MKYAIVTANESIEYVQQPNKICNENKSFEIQV